MAFLNNILDSLNVSPLTMIIAGLIFFGLCFTSLYSVSSKVNKIIFNSLGHVSKISLIVGLLSCVTFFGGILQSGVIDGIARLNTQKDEVLRLYQESVELAVSNEEENAIEELLDELGEENLVKDLADLIEENEVYSQEIRAFEKIAKVAIREGVLTADEAKFLIPEELKSLNISVIRELPNSRYKYSDKIFSSYDSVNSWSILQGEMLKSEFAGASDASPKSDHLDAIKRVFSGAYDSTVKETIRSTIVNTIPEELGRSFFELLIDETFHGVVQDKIDSKVESHFNENINVIARSNNDKAELIEKLGHVRGQIDGYKAKLGKNRELIGQSVSSVSEELVSKLKSALSSLGPFDDSPNLKKAFSDFEDNILIKASTFSNADELLELFRVIPDLMEASAMPEHVQAKVISDVEESYMKKPGVFSRAFQVSDLNITDEFISDVARKVYDGEGLTSQERKLMKSYQSKGMCMCWYMRGTPRPKNCGDPRCV